MSERNYTSVTELFSVKAPELLDMLKLDDDVWRSIRDNSISDSEIGLHLGIMTELGMRPDNSALVKALVIVAQSRKVNLSTPIQFVLGS